MEALNLFLLQCDKMKFGAIYQYGFKNLQRKHCHSFSFPFWNARKTRNKWKEIKIRNNHVNLKQTIIQQSF